MACGRKRPEKLKNRLRKSHFFWPVSLFCCQYARFFGDAFCKWLLLIWLKPQKWGNAIYFNPLSISFGDGSGLAIGAVKLDDNVGVPDLRLDPQKLGCAPAAGCG
jgi:hypothetical protein